MRGLGEGFGPVYDFFFGVVGVNVFFSVDLPLIFFSLSPPGCWLALSGRFVVFWKDGLFLRVWVGVKLFFFFGSNNKSSDIFEIFDLIDSQELIETSEGLILWVNDFERDALVGFKGTFLLLACKDGVFA